LSRQSYCKESRVQFFWPTLYIHLVILADKAWHTCGQHYIGQFEDSAAVKIEIYYFTSLSFVSVRSYPAAHSAISMTIVLHCCPIWTTCLVSQTVTVKWTCIP